MPITSIKIQRAAKSMNSNQPSDQHLPSNPENPNQAYKTNLKQLTAQKGRLSRQIGERKKQLQPIDDLLVEMKSLSIAIKKIEAQLKSLKKATTHAKEVTSFPGHITENPCRSNEHLSIPYQIREISSRSVNRHEEVSAWNQYAKAHPAACIYHQIDFQDIIEKSFDHKTLYIAAFDPADELVGILPLTHTKSRLFGSYMTSVPYFNYGGPLSNNKTIEQQLLTYAEAYAKQNGATHVEIRESQPRAGMPSKMDKMSTFLALPTDSEQLWQDIGTKVRAQVKKGMKNSLTFTTGKHELLDDFYHVFSTNMRDLGTPIYSKAFFNHILSSDLNATIVVQYYQQKPVSCAFLMGYKDHLEIPWASTLRRANTLDANMVMYWHILKFACENGYRFFDFGRSSKDASTLKFKRQWGAKPTQLYWHYILQDNQELPNLNPSNPKLQFVIACWKRLPLIVANALGPLLSRSLP